jgi:hypothetical protein
VALQAQYEIDSTRVPISPHTGEQNLYFPARAAKDYVSNTEVLARYRSATDACSMGGKQTKYNGIFGSLITMIREEGVKGFFKVLALVPRALAHPLQGKRHQLHSHCALFCRAVLHIRELQGCACF